MTDREIYLGTVAALVRFIRENASYGMPSDAGLVGGHWADPRGIHAKLDAIVAGQERHREDDAYWGLKAKVLELFLRKAPELRDMMLPIAFSGANISRASSYDPLTHQGLEEVTHFINNGLLDDWWIAIYRKGGTARIVNEMVDDEIQAKRGVQGTKLAGRLDMSDEWMRGADRHVLSFRNYDTVLAEELAAIVPSIPSQDDLSSLWISRPYDDFHPPVADVGLDVEQPAGMAP